VLPSCLVYICDSAVFWALHDLDRRAQPTRCFSAAAELRVIVCIGLVQELDLHRYETASQHLSVPGTYVLVKRQSTSPGLDNEDEIPADSSYEYVPLLNNYLQLMPGYRVHRTAGGGPAGEAARKRVTDDSRRKSHQNPATARSSRTKQTKDRSPGKKSSTKT